ncbi:hypothetical protein HMPREF0591_0535 [Mycobacterium parascrofulaceum ATCC BAA-614]|uniref:Uncharacterized protein n=1 Tax=Mycobacterium parascrofulaceum ATCC BAA-614 TaxID=525368 RepID=D5P2Z1_9MYCO|nr:MULTISPECIES: hypothetical protein [Mycobacterium]EFG79558.1 hypothetical protein HMPREF0591_0535 [Mycobacterium parascrofulaceum ATCC BAA-614]OCB62294.1 hypothetical protein A9X02_05595 [Mycobacterium malmoense]
MRRRRAAEQAAREERASAIRRCRRCDPCGWLLGPDHTPIDPAVRCSHGPPEPEHQAAPTHPTRSFSEPIRQPDLFSEE